ncbi:MAG: cytochrome c oxidase subunit II [Flavobacteriales bacterium]|jgi:cytochrome c oxidase subunit 2|tara:strand:+ start:4933 stop:6081 length:1149 start_codon:yes stop_codon:yes gene_type:complete
MTELLIIVAIVVAVIAIAQVVKIFELANKIKGVKESDITDKDNDTQGKLLLTFGILFMASFFVMTAKWNHLLLPISASEHGVEIDLLMNISMGVIIIVFLITQPILFFLSYKYRGRKDRTATFISHNDKAEIIWTIVPAVVLTVLIVYGLQTWSKIMDRSDLDDAVVVELYGKQFDWTARYAGADNNLGAANVRFIGGLNTVGVISESAYAKQMAGLDNNIAKAHVQMSEELNANKRVKIEARLAKMESKKSTLTALVSITPKDLLEAAEDDVVVKELHLPVNKTVHLKFRSQDVIHSAYLPHFRVQMNCVPGMNTDFVFKPTITTEEMRVETGNEAFEYVLLCNKICGAAHYNMQLKVIVESEEDYNKWMAEQSVFAASNN